MNGSPGNDSELDRRHMARALQLAARGRGYVEPNPMVGCVIARDDQILGEGYHTRHGAAHAEIEALRDAGQASLDKTTMYVTLEPCCHHGKTPPCSEAVIRSGIPRIVVAHRDPFPQVAGGGIGQLRDAGRCVEVGLLESESRALNAPYLRLIETGRPWMIAKWAMTLDGKIASQSGSSQWISGPDSRAIVQALRGRVDAIMVGGRTAALDDPRLTARPPGPRTATRIVVSGKAEIALNSRLIRTIDAAPILIAVGPEAAAESRRALEDAGCEIFTCDAPSPIARLALLLEELGRRRMTNVLVEGGGQLLGSLFDLNMIDEVHTFIASKLVGGDRAATPIAGRGMDQMSQAVLLDQPSVESVGDDVYVHGRIKRAATSLGVPDSP
jgi:diaminohydroxyphosphoribosylaminopyrimidine deaminase/5-amino-6-(5-phosphoribosylamino)uracil reductase